MLTDVKLGNKGYGLLTFSGHNPSLRKVRAGTQAGWELETEPIKKKKKKKKKNASYWIASWLIFTTAQIQLLRVDHSHSELSLHKLISNQKLPHIYPQANWMKIAFQLLLPPPWYVKLTSNNSHHTTILRQENKKLCNCVFTGFYLIAATVYKIHQC